MSYSCVKRTAYNLLATVVRKKIIHWEVVLHSLREVGWPHTLKEEWACYPAPEKGGCA